MRYKVTGFLHGFVPFLLCTLIQYIAVFYLLFVYALVFLFKGNSFFDLFDGFALFFRDTQTNYSIMIIYSTICICFFGLWYYRKCAGEFGRSAFKEFNAFFFIGTVLLVPGLQVLSSIICSIISVVDPSSMEYYEELIESVGLTDVTLFVFLYSVILAPLCEELIFRGVTLRLFQRVIKPFFICNILQAILFGILHGNVVQGVYAGVLGLFLGFVCEKGGTIYYSIILHILFNFWGVIVSKFLSILDSSVVFELLFIVFCFCTFVVGLIFLYIGLRRKRSTRKIRE